MDDGFPGKPLTTGFNKLAKWSGIGWALCGKLPNDNQSGMFAVSSRRRIAAILSLTRRLKGDYREKDGRHCVKCLT
ncbi:hypothetical protein GURASL_08250 [Geotalea uraniireducens]|uniref:Transposase n=1 Tax=Geotalea uraniireducens TaxID=351604 RepID=A0ABN6VRA0_9BACT|nr:hypothetical protein GURASL_08250 [Geotalea uraniireducens]